jgi:hypothetical protein
MTSATSGSDVFIEVLLQIVVTRNFRDGADGSACTKKVG